VGSGIVSGFRGRAAAKFGESGEEVSGGVTINSEYLYHYRAVIRDVYDGDTCRADLDLGLKIWVMDETLRLLRINAPEVRGVERPAGLLARDFLREQIQGKEVVVQTSKDSKGKYGRYLAEIWLKGEGDQWININDLMVQQGHAVYHEY
jgi:micrococcal nuclease